MNNKINEKKLEDYNARLVYNAGIITEASDQSEVKEELGFAIQSTLELSKSLEELDDELAEVEIPLQEMLDAAGRDGNKPGENEAKHLLKMFDGVFRAHGTFEKAINKLLSEMMRSQKKI